MRYNTGMFLSTAGNFKRLVIFIISGLLLAVVHHFAIATGLYWTFPELDILSHFLGGLVTALALRFLIQRFSTGLFSTVFVLVGTLAVGVLWEVFEILTKTTGASKEVYVKDTSLDIVMDMVGALVAIAL